MADKAAIGTPFGTTGTKALSRAAAIFFIAAAINYPWEVAQAPLYVGQGSLAEAAVHCIVPSLGDGIIVLILYGIGVLVLRRWDWSDRPGLQGYALLLVCGFTIAVAVEWGALHVLERWQYTASMPQLPGFGVGLAPVLQMLVLPAVVLKLSAWWLARGLPAGPS